MPQTSPTEPAGQAEPTPPAAPDGEPGAGEATGSEPAVPATPRAPPVPRRRRWPLRLARGLLVALILPGAALAGAELGTPPVGDAPTRVAAIDRAHGAVPVQADPSWRLSQAVVAAEDGTFYSNHGVDVVALARALWGRVIGVDLGGSTITEQLAKVIYTGGQTGLTERVAQLALALKLDGHYAKPAILSMYLSAVYYGNGYYGVIAASQGYFGLPPDRLSWGQAALLAGLPQAPSGLDPLQHLGAARQRQSYVLSRLVATGVLTQEQAAAAGQAPLGLR